MSERRSVMGQLRECGSGQTLRHVILLTLVVGLFQSPLNAMECKKLALSRALYKGAPILVLDEPTAWLDPKSEQQFLSQLAQAPSPCKIIITHKLSAAVKADTILVMQEGKVVEQGTHHELMSRQGEYSALYRAQFARDGKASVAWQTGDAASPFKSVTLQPL